MKKLLSIVIPMYNEEEIILTTYNRLTEVLEKLDYNYELIFVDDYSHDNSFNIIKEISIIDKNIKCIKFSKNFGHQIAVTAGIYNAKGDAVILIDADLQDPPEVIPLMVKKWEEGAYVCYGVRNIRRGESRFKIITAKLFYRFLDKMSETKIPVDTGDFRIMDKKVVEEFKKMPEKNRFIRGMISYIGFKQEPIYYDRDKRYAGETKYSIKKMISFAFNGIISFSNKPLDIIFFLSFIPLLASIVFFLIFIENLNTIYIISSVFSLFFCFILFSIAIIGQYIKRIYEEEKGRPLYLIEELINF